MYASTLDIVLPTVAAFLKAAFEKSGDAFKAHLSLVYSTRDMELPRSFSNKLYMQMTNVKLDDAVDTILHYLKINDFEHTAQVLRLFTTYDTTSPLCPISISPENDDDDDTLSWDDIQALQANQDMVPQDLPSTSDTSASQDMFQDSQSMDTI